LIAFIGLLEVVEVGFGLHKEEIEAAGTIAAIQNDAAGGMVISGTHR